MKTIKPKTLIGKTIKSVDTRAINVWHIEFTDGSSISISGEIGSLGLACLELTEKW